MDPLGPLGPRAAGDLARAALMERTTPCYSAHRQLVRWLEGCGARRPPEHAGEAHLLAAALALPGRIVGMDRDMGTDMGKDELDQLREEAEKHIADMPAETALGNADPDGPHEETPKEWEAEHPGPTG